MCQVKRLLPYVRRYVQMAVYDVLDAEGAEYWKNESGAVVARLSVYGNVSTFSLSTEIQDVGTGLTVSVRDPCPGLSAKGEERAVTAVADMVAQYLENELMINRRSPAERSSAIKGKTPSISFCWSPAAYWEYWTAGGKRWWSRNKSER